MPAQRPAVAPIPGTGTPRPGRPRGPRLRIPVAARVLATAGVLVAAGGVGYAVAQSSPSHRRPRHGDPRRRRPGPRRTRRPLTGGHRLRHGPGRRHRPVRRAPQRDDVWEGHVRRAGCRPAACALRRPAPPRQGERRAVPARRPLGPGPVRGAGRGHPRCGRARWKWWTGRATAGTRPRSSSWRRPPPAAHGLRRRSPVFRLGRRHPGPGPAAQVRVTRGRPGQPRWICTSGTCEP